MTKEQWTAIKNRDPAFDGCFCYALKGRKTVCRPSCGARSCSPGDVIVFDSLEDALAGGYRPCSRCRPDLPGWGGARKALAEAAEDYIRRHYTEKFSLEALANALHMDRSYVLRSFKAVTGGTLLEFHNRTRCEKAKELLQRPELSISYIASAVGYVSASHFSQVFRRYEGSTPLQYRAAYLRSLDAEE